MTAVEGAPAKINVTLTITGRRADGYHTLESLVAFAHDVQDEVRLVPGPDLALTVAGATAGDAGATDDNLVLRAARALMARQPGLRAGAFFLKKSLPVAAGLGGGSADAAAALRLLARANNLAPDAPVLLAAAQATGADVAVCLKPQARVMRGIGADVGPAVDFAAPQVLLVNPRQPCPTPLVFQALGLAVGARAESPARSDAQICAGWRTIGNDLQGAAVAQVPLIATVLATLAGQRGCSTARMSGSGATCFGIFDRAADCAQAAEQIAQHHPGWWVARTALG